MSVIVLDVNETMLDLSGLDDPFAEVFGDRGPEVKRLWFARLLHTSVVMTVLGTWQDFGVVGAAVLTDVATSLDLPVDDAQVSRIVGTMRHLEAYPDVRPGLTALRAAGHDLVALTNSGQPTAEAQLAAAGIDDLFDRIISVDAVLAFKPDQAVYTHCREEMGAPASAMVLVAAHDWDCSGAMRAGWRAAHVDRPGRTYNPLLQAPTWRGADLTAVAEVLLADLP